MLTYLVLVTFFALGLVFVMITGFAFAQPSDRRSSWSMTPILLASVPAALTLMGLLALVILFVRNADFN